MDLGWGFPFSKFLYPLHVVFSEKSTMAIARLLEHLDGTGKFTDGPCSLWQETFYIFALFFPLMKTCMSFLWSYILVFLVFHFLFFIFYSYCCPDQEPKWQVGYVYTPADAIAQVLKTLSLNETRELSRTISNWFRRFEDWSASSSTRRENVMLYQCWVCVYAISVGSLIAKF